MNRTFSTYAVGIAITVLGCGGSSFQSTSGAAGATSAGGTNAGGTSGGATNTAGNSAIAGAAGTVAAAGNASDGGAAGAGGSAGAASTGTKMIADPCGADAECASGQCVMLGPDDTSGVCSTSCTMNKECPVDTACYNLAAKTLTTPVCVPNCTTGNQCTMFSKTWSCNRGKTVAGTVVPRCGAWLTLGDGLQCESDSQCSSGKCTGDEQSAEGYCISPNPCTSNDECCANDANCVAACVQSMSGAQKNYFCQRLCTADDDCKLIGATSMCSSTVDKMGTSVHACY